MDDNGDGDDGNDKSMLQITHATLDLVASSSERDIPIDTRRLDKLVDKAKVRLLCMRARDSLLLPRLCLS